LVARAESERAKNSAAAASYSALLVSAFFELLADLCLGNSITFPVVSRFVIGVSFVTNLRASNWITFPMALDPSAVTPVAGVAANLYDRWAATAVNQKWRFR
jgi:hypothetical protein